MKWPFFCRKKASGDEEALLDRYKQLRSVSRELNMLLVKQLPKPAVQECGKKLGIFKAGTLILNNDDEMAVLFDYGLYNYQRGGKNAIERHIENAKPQPDSDEGIVLRAMMDAHYSVFRVEEILPRRGARLRDLVGGETIDLMDIGLSETGSPGILLAGRVLPLADFHMSTGTLIPLPEEAYEEKILPIFRKYLKTDTPEKKPELSPGQKASFTAEIIRTALHAGGEDNVFYTDIER